MPIRKYDFDLFEDGNRNNPIEEKKVSIEDDLGFDDLFDVEALLNWQKASKSYGVIGGKGGFRGTRTQRFNEASMDDMAKENFYKAKNIYKTQEVEVEVEYDGTEVIKKESRNFGAQLSSKRNLLLMKKAMLNEGDFYREAEEYSLMEAVKSGAITSEQYYKIMKDFRNKPEEKDAFRSVIDIENKT